MSSNVSGATSATQEEHERGHFTSRKVFILAAIGSAVGLGNIWRFPYVAYENGGGAFIIPYLVALLVAGLPFLMLDYAVGHRYRGSAPLSFRRMGRGTEVLGWWQVGICAVIAVYYAVIIAWALRYTFFSVDQAWGDDPGAFLTEDFLQAADAGISLDMVAGVLVPLLVVWVAVIAIMVAGVQKGIGSTAVFFIPLLVLAFLALVIRSLFLPGAGEGLDALFTPNWDALTDTGVWAAAFGQIFFSLSIGFGIMITYASYVGRRTDMTGSGLVVGFANSGFELLAGIGVFAALGFMAQASGVAVGEVASGGIGLAFIAFPTIISEAPGGALIGVLFFGSLVIAGLTSLVSVIEVVISAVRDKLALGRRTASLIVGVPAAVISVLLFATTTGLPILDTADHFINRFGILLVAVLSMLVVAWIALVAAITPAALTFVLVQEFRATVEEPYGGYPQWFLNTFGWGTAAVVLVVAVLATVAPWHPRVDLSEPKEVER